ncbi:tRNA1(Val) (adenine(37)-N6)-methyltransferase [Pseudothermotoga sp.]|nr:methyltransferase [Pseudothermotoga sp.]MCX7812524.1 methyltransferase [Pseudothermotoga sp.]MDW8138805.1 methyltransferase [Pseudothermotoga sp.]
MASSRSFKDDFDPNLLRNVRVPDLGKDHRPTHASTLLAWYARPKDGDLVVELGCGIGIVSAYLAMNHDIVVYSIEKNPLLADAAHETVRLNSLEGRMFVHNVSCEQVRMAFEAEKFDLVICNPPHHLTGVPSPSKLRSESRSSNLKEAETFIEATFYLLRNRGKFVFVLSCEHLMFWTKKFLERKLQPKWLVPVYGEPKRNAVLMIVKGVKNGGIGLKIEPPVVLKRA